VNNDQSLTIVTVLLTLDWQAH